MLNLDIHLQFVRNFVSIQSTHTLCTVVNSERLVLGEANFLLFGCDASLGPPLRLKAYRAM